MSDHRDQAGFPIVAFGIIALPVVFGIVVWFGLS